MSVPTISIITVTYNAAKYIQSTMKSVSDQSFTDYEHLIIDGASSDDTLLIVDNFRRAQLVIYSEPDKGLYDAMNKALTKAKGEYILFLNAGDVFYDEDTLTKVFSKARGEDFIYGDTTVINEAGDTRSYHKKKPSQASISYRSFIDGMVVCHQSMIVKAEKVVLFDNINYTIASDIDWAIRTLKNCKSFLDADMYISKFLDGGVSQNNRIKAVKERFWICVKHFGWLKTLWQQCKIGYTLINNKMKITLNN